MVDDERPSGPPRGRGSWTGLHRSGSTRAARPSRADRVAALWQNSELDGVPVDGDTDGLPEPVPAVGEPSGGADAVTSAVAADPPADDDAPADGTPADDLAAGDPFAGDSPVDDPTDVA